MTQNTLIQPQSEDTSAVTDRWLVDRWRAMSSNEKVRMIGGLQRAANLMARAGARLRYPSAGEREIDLRVAALTLGRDLMIRAYSWDPDVRGW